IWLSCERGDFTALQGEYRTDKSPDGASWACASLLAKRRDLRCPYASAQATVGRFPEGAARARPLKSHRWFCPSGNRVCGDESDHGINDSLGVIDVCSVARAVRVVGIGVNFQGVYFPRHPDNFVVDMPVDPLEHLFHCSSASQVI